MNVTNALFTQKQPQHHLSAKPLGLERAKRPGIAWITLTAFLGTQCLFPMALVHAQTAPPAGGGVAAKADPKQPGIKPSKALRRLNRYVSTRQLDLSRPPSEEELMAAGGMGGVLTPIRSAKPNEWAKAGADAKQIQRLLDMNLSFGKAVVERNKRNFRVTAQLMAKHLEDYPESPWAGEAVLHLAMDAQSNGRFAEAQQRFEDILKNTSEDPTSINYDLHQKAKVGWAEVDLRMGQWASAAQKLRNIMATEVDWRRRTWALTWLYNLSSQKKNATKTNLKLLACGTQALAVVFASLGKKAASAKLAEMAPPRAEGFSLAELVDLSQRHGLPMRGFRANVQQLASLPLPAVIHYEVGRSKSSEKAPAAKAQAASAGTQTLLCEHCIPAKPGMKASRLPLAANVVDMRVIKALDAKNRPTKTRTTKGNLFPNAFQPRSVGHFLIVQHVDVKKQSVQLYDPQEKKKYRLSFAQLEREWSGTGLVIANRVAPSHKNINPARTIMASASNGRDTQVTSPKRGQFAKAFSKGTQPSGNLLSLTWLTNAEMKRIRGGCCCLPWPWGPLGPPENAPGGDPSGPTNCPQGAPSVSINPLTLNMYIEDTPLWYDTPIGPDVKITMSYNSQDSLNHNTAFGNKWTFNYGSYVIENPDGAVIVFMPTGRQDLFFPAPGGGYAGVAGNFNTLSKISANRFELQSPEGDKLIYDIPSGTNSLQPFLIEERDRRGNSLTFGYNSSVRLTTITDAQGKVTTLTYDTNGRITRVDDPFGRHTAMAYDTQGNMVKVADMEGNGFTYTYDADILMTQLNTAQGNWSYLHETVYYNTSTIWKMGITTTNPLGQTDKVYFGDNPPAGTTGTSIRYTNRRGHNTYWVSNQTIDGEGKINDVVYPNGDRESFVYDTRNGLPTVFINNAGKATRLTYNARGEVTSVTDPKNQTTRYYYASNGIDLTSVVDARNVTVATYSYNGYHQPIAVTRDPAVRNESTSIDYTTWGAVAYVTDANNRTTTYNYNTAKQLTSITRPNGGSTATLGSYTYDSIGRVRTVADAGGTTLTYDYNDLNQVTKVTYPGGSYTETDYVCCRAPGVLRDRSGRRTYYDYDALFRVSRMQDTQGNVFSYEYDGEDNLTQIIDSQGSVTHFTYDSLQRLVKKTYVGGGYQSYSYDLAGNMQSYRDGRGIVTTYSYDDNDNLTKIDYPSTTDVTLQYDELDRPTQMVDAVGTRTFGYNNLSQMTSADGPWASDTVTYGYTPLGQRQTMRVNNTDEASYIYDPLDRLDALTSAVAGSFDYAYSGNTDLLSSLSRPNGTISNYTYDSLERLLSLSNRRQSDNSLLIKHTYGYDTSTQREGRQYVDRQVGTDPVARTSYTYDALDQLTRELSNETTPIVDVAYGYDRMGSRTSAVRNGGPSAGGTQSTFTLNPLNQIANHAYTNAQNQTTDFWFGYWGGNTANSGNNVDQSRVDYFWDDAERLREIVFKNAQGVNDKRSVFVYDGFSRKAIAREYTWNGTNSTWTQVSETRSVHDGMEVVQERDGSNVIQTKYVRDGNIGGLLSKSTSTDTFFYHYDGQGNVVQMSDAAKAVVAEYRYDAFGNTLSATGTQAQGNRYRFSTKELHTTSGLYDYGYRFYSPGLGRWINRDPIEEAGGLNLYGFVGNDPANWGDEYGERPDLAVAAAGVATGIAVAINIYRRIRPLVGPLTKPSKGPTTRSIRPAIRPKSGCFTAGTLIATSEGSRPIEDVEVGDLVWARDEKTGELALQRVTHTFEHQVDQLVVLHVAGEDIETTAEHPFWVQGKGWVKAGELQTGDVLETLNGSTLTIQSVEVVARACRVYNLEVEGFHTYFVAKHQVFVHNKAKPKKNKPRPTPTPCPEDEDPKKYPDDPNVFLNRNRPQAPDKTRDAPTRFNQQGKRQEQDEGVQKASDQYKKWGQPDRIRGTRKSRDRYLNDPDD